MLLSFMMLLSFIGSASAFAASPEDPPPVGPLEISLSSGDVVRGYTQKSSEFRRIRSSIFPWHQIRQCLTLDATRIARRSIST